MPSGTITNKALHDALLAAEAVVDNPASAPLKHMKTLADAINSSACFRNALLKGREVFVLSSEDEIAPHAIRAWARLAAGAGVEDKAIDAEIVANRWLSLDYTRTPT